MPAQFTLPPDTRAVGTGNPPADMNAVIDAVAALGAGMNVLNTAFAGGADPTGAVACDAAVLAALGAVPAGGGTIYFPAGTFLFSGSTMLALTTANTVITGAGMSATTLRIMAGFSAAALFSVDADNCTISNMQIRGNSTTIASNGQAIAIQVRARNVNLPNLRFFYVNGYCCKVINLTPGGSHQVNHQPHIHNWYMESCSGGIWLHGDNATMGAILSDVHGNSIGGGTDATLDALRLEDVFDVNFTNNCSSVSSATSGHSVHLVGHVAQVWLVGGDIGAFPIPGAGGGQCGVKMEDGANGNASQIRISGYVFQTHDTGVSIPGAAHDIRFTDCDIAKNNADGVDLAGTGVDIYFRGCALFTNGQQPPASTNVFDVNWSGTAHGQFSDCVFGSNIVAQGSAGVQFSVSIGARNRDQHFPNTRFSGTGSTSSNWFNAANNFPRMVRVIGGSPGLTPRQPAIAASTTAVTNDTGMDATVHIAGGTVSAVAVGGTAITSITSSPAVVRVPVNQTVTLTYSSAPTWQWFGD